MAKGERGGCLSGFAPPFSTRSSSLPLCKFDLLTATAADGMCSLLELLLLLHLLLYLRCSACSPLELAALPVPAPYLPPSRIVCARQHIISGLVQHCVPKYSCAWNVFDPTQSVRIVWLATLETPLPLPAAPCPAA